MLFAQTERPIKLTTPLGEDQFILTSLSGSEYISGLFQFELATVWQGSSPVVFKDILGKSVTASVEMHQVTRYFNGIVKSITQGARVPERDLTWYNITIVPTMWLLTRNVNCRIFQKMDAPTIIQNVLKAAGVTELEVKLQHSYTKRDYCVQYYETDFAFVSRLMEFEGICYFFKHEQGKHTLVLSDDKSSFADLPNGADVTFEEIFGGVRPDGRIYDWQKAQEINSGKYSLNDYNFETPDASMLADTTTNVKLENNAALEIYQNPGGYLSKSAGEDVASLRMAEEEMRAQVVHGKSLTADLRPGYKFNLKDHFADNGKFTVTGVTHAAQQPLDPGAGGQEFSYENQFTCISFNVQYRPACVTPLPTTRGVQTALVVGPGGEEIYTDNYGRVKVQFHWDREGKNNENSSCWIRVATYWAGKQWGAIHIPRIGQEVIVDFVEGDVDRPIIVGSVYNANQMPPYGLPGDATKSTLKSNSSKGGGGFNELRFEDKKSSEEVYFHAEKDLNSVIENNESRKVGSAKADDGSRTTEIYNNETLSVKTGDQTTTVEQGNQSTTVSMGNQSTDIKMGNQTTKVEMGSIDTEAMQSITLKVGQSSIVIDPTGVTIKGMMITIQGQVQVQVSATMVQVSGDAMTTIKGGIVMIN
jgi:type VI secretion system secreted protein VgrG